MKRKLILASLLGLTAVGAFAQQVEPTLAVPMKEHCAHWAMIDGQKGLVRREFTNLMWAREKPILTGQLHIVVNDAASLPNTLQSSRAFLSLNIQDSRPADQRQPYVIEIAGVQLDVVFHAATP